jgi:hypothetical protein
MTQAGNAMLVNPSAASGQHVGLSSSRRNVCRPRPVSARLADHASA